MWSHPSVSHPLISFSKDASLKLNAVEIQRGFCYKGRIFLAGFKKQTNSDLKQKGNTKAYRHMSATTDLLKAFKLTELEQVCRKIQIVRKYSTTEMGSSKPAVPWM
ncbi:hypothetical protein XENOCAPTIV_006272 [Xenoophorus captivus]|uniref:Uncharacterized protein n=2 Tax=Goodeidae TaxID=28758 RepID=A0ABV0S6I9_9TELE